MLRLYRKGDVLRGRFEIEGLLKSGGLSHVYLGFDRQTQKKIVVKCPVYDDDYSKNNGIKLERLMIESQVLRTLNHPYIVRYVDSWNDGGDYHLVTEHVDAKNMNDIYKYNPPNINDTLEYTLQLLEAIEYLHYKGIIHRDIKPANILLWDNIVLLDFGASEAKFLNLSHHNITIGTPGYQCPESFRGMVSHQCDIYSIGATLLFLLTGEKPSGDLLRFRSMTPHAELLEIALKAMNPYPANRFRTVFEMKKSLEKILHANLPMIIIGSNHFVVAKDRILIGRGNEADVKIADPFRYVSPVHAEIRKDGDQFCIVDKSINGTYIYRNEEYKKIDRWYLSDGDMIVLCYSSSKGPYKTMKFRNMNQI